MSKVALYGQLQAYDEKQSWEDYVEIMEHYFSANGINDDKMRVSIFCSTVGVSTYRLAKSLCLPRKPQDCKFEEIIRHLNKHYEPRPTEATESLKFGKRDRKQGETIQVYVAELRKIAEHCNFGTFMERALRDRLLTGCNDIGMQRELLKIPNDKFSFKKALEVCESIESTSRNLKEIASASSNASSMSSETSSVHKVNPKHMGRDNKGGNPRDRQPRERDTAQGQGGKYMNTPQAGTSHCWRCGKTDHGPQNCYYRNQKCYQCKKKGHAKAVCKQKSVNQVDGRRDCDSSGEDYDEEDFMNLVNHISSKVPPLMTNVLINGSEVNVELDTGCPLTILNQSSAQKVLGNLTLKPLGHKLKSYTGHDLDVQGSTQVQIAYKGRECTAQVVVVKGPRQTNLLGRDVMTSLSMITIKQVSEGGSSPELGEMLANHKDVFKDELGTLNGTKAKILVDSDAQPKFFKPRSLPYAMRPKVDEELDRLLKEKVIEPVTFSDWAAPIVPVLKPDGTVRVCGDFKVTVNQASKLEQYPLPTLEDLRWKLAGGEKFTKLDLSHAYFQLMLDEESKKYTTINTHRGMFQYNRLPFGISSAPAIFQRTIESLLQGIENTAVYIDDIILTGKTDMEHLRTLDQVLERLSKAGVRLKESKCYFMAEEVTYLGHRIDKEGIHPVPDKVKAIANARRPENVTELKSFLGLLNYYGNFLPDLATRLAPLHKLLRKEQKWMWGKAQEESFQSVKELILSADVLAPYDPTKELYLQCDASPYGVGAVLSVKDSDGTERPVGFASRSLTDAEKNYSQLDREGLAVIFGLKKFHKYVFGRPFTILTDHKPLITLFNEMKQVPSTSLRVQRWALLLRGYEYHIEYRPGQSNGNADCLSRLPLPGPKPSKVKEEERVLLIEELDHSPVTASQVQAWTSKDPVLANVREYVLRGWPDHESDPSLAPYRVRKTELSVKDGVLLWGARVIVPPQGRESVIKELHMAHPGVNRMKALARSYVWWPKMEHDLEQVVKSCDTCQLNRNSPSSAPLHPWEQPERPWSRVHIDYAGPFMGHMILVQVDATTKWIEATVMPSAKAEPTIEQLRETFARYGIPEVLVSDNAGIFIGEDFEEFMRKNGILHVTSAPYHPSSNGLAERAVQTVKAGLKKATGDSLRTKLNRFLFQYRMTPTCATGKSPSELLNHRKMRSLLDLLHPNLQGKIHKKQMEMKAKHDGGKVVRSYQCGDTVSVKNFASGAKWLHGTIERITGPLSYEVRLLDGRIVRRHVDHIITRQVDNRSSTTEVPIIQQPSGEVIVTEPNIIPEPVSVSVEKDSSQSEHEGTTTAADSNSLPSASPPLPTVEEETALLRRSSRARQAPTYLQDFELNIVSDKY